MWVETVDKNGGVFWYVGSALLCNRKRFCSRLVNFMRYSIRLIVILKTLEKYTV